MQPTRVNRMTGLDLARSPEDERRRFHTFAHEDADNPCHVDEDPLIEVATDMSLDEGAILRTTAGYDTPFGSRVQYFVGLDSVECQILLDALRDRLEVDDDAEWILHRIQRCWEYLVRGSA